MASKKILVYVQALPISVPSRAKNFADLSNLNLRMSHSSKAALDKAVGLSENVVALGHSSILREALARGSKEAIPIPLYDDPLAQAESMKNFLTDLGPFSILVGENLDGPFSGAALCGALSSVYDLTFSFDSDLEDGGGSVVLVKDSGTKAFNIDIRKIDYASTKEFAESKFVGSIALEKYERAQPIQLSKEQAPKDIASTISRKIRRLSSLS
ncbi:MAG: hypothetical protein PXY39_07825 [archaeon]|nr:hypothetical protein [archaeon]